jgi:thiol-disulfide isomerase/thioredoxin
MKLRTLIAGLALALFALSTVRAEEAAAAATAKAGDPAADMNALVGQIQAKLRAGKSSAADLKPEIDAFDALVAKYKDQKTEEVARISLMRATLYLQVLEDETKGRELLTQIKTDFPGTKAAENVDQILQMIDQQKKAKEAETAVVGKAAPELHFQWSSQEGLKKLSDLKGKVVVLDFWATWCGPCIASFPQMRQLVEHYKGSDVVIVGVTSIQGRVVNLEPAPIDTKGDPQKEISLLPAFIKAKDMTWAVAVSDEQVFNPDYGIVGIPHMTIIAPDGTVRFNDLHPAMPEAMKTEKIDGILKEFHLPVPAEKKA